ncbi:MAG: hypothetical protein R3B54_15325 [Bdellovibrionota bacterium]
MKAPADADPKLLDNPASEEELRMPLWQHLDELRSAIIRVLLVLGVLVTVLFNYSEYVIVLLEKPCSMCYQEIANSTLPVSLTSS